MSALDTSGVVPTTDRSFWGGVVKWSDISPFTQGYIEALFASEGERLTDEAIQASGQTAAEWGAMRFSDLAPETLARIIADCEAMASAGLPEKPEHQHRAGRSAWEWRQLQQRPGFPPLTVQLGDDGKVRFAQ